jgi:tetratricopeptide (TPR) repeat protein
MRIASALVAAVTTALAPAAHSQRSDQAELVERADEALDRQTPAAYAEAIKLYEEARRAEPDDVDLKLKHAQALVGFMRSTTDANIPRADGSTVDTAENRAVWSEHAPKAVRLAEQAVNARPRSLEARAVHLEAITYDASSRGILRSLFASDARTFREAAEALVELDPSYEAAMGLSLLAGYHLVAPRPIGSLAEARAYADRAVQQSPDTSLPRYFQGVAALQQGATEQAREAFHWVVVNDCAPQSARDYCAYIKREARRGLDIANAS